MKKRFATEKNNGILVNKVGISSAILILEKIDTGIRFSAVSENVISVLYNFIKRHFWQN